jgi:hypothetical protein
VDLLANADSTLSLKSEKTTIGCIKAVISHYISWEDLGKRRWGDLERSGHPERRDKPA